MISQTVEYALRAVVALAQESGHPITARRLSEITQVPYAYLSKLMQVLVRSGLVQSQRGINGGFFLNADPKKLSLWEIVHVVEPLKRIEFCPLGIPSHQKLCPLHARLDCAIAASEAILREAIVADLLSDDGSGTPLCKVPAMTLVPKHSRGKKR